MIGFIFVGIPIICIIVLIVMGCSGGGQSSKSKDIYVYLHDEDGEIVDYYVDRSGMYCRDWVDVDDLEDEIMMFGDGEWEGEGV